MNKFITKILLLFSLFLLPSCAENVDVEKINNKNANETHSTIELYNDGVLEEGSCGYFSIALKNTTFSCGKFSIFYDPNYLEIFEGTDLENYVYVDESIGEFFVSNIKEPGVIQFTYVFMEDRDFNDSILLGFNLMSKPDSISEDTNTYIDLLVEECFDKNLQDVSLKSSGLNLKIRNNNYLETEIFPDLDLFVYSGQPYIDEELKFDVYFYGSNPFNCGEIKISYDPNYFEFVSYEYLELSNFFLKDINFSRPGEILVSFINIEELCNPGYLLSFVLMPISEGYTDITMELNNFSNREFVKFENTQISYFLEVIKNPNFAPGVGLTQFENLGNNNFKTIFYISKETNLGAGDFDICFDSNLVSLISYKIIQNNNYSLGVNTKKAEEGVISISLLSMKGLVEEYNLVEFVFNIEENIRYDSEITIHSFDTVDPNFNTIDLRMGNLTITHTHFSENPTIYYPSTCGNHGLKIYSCDYCGAYVEEVLELSTEHINTEERFDEENGIAYVYCNDCNTNLSERPMELIDYVNRWIDRFLYMYSISLEDEGSGLCLGEWGYYHEAKRALIELEQKHPGAMLEFYNNGDRDAYERFVAWATANGEVFNPFEGTITKALSANTNIFNEISTNYSSVAIIVSCIGAASILAIFIFKRKKTK